jgi:hypothetical protein
VAHNRHHLLSDRPQQASRSCRARTEKARSSRKKRKEGKKPIIRTQHPPVLAKDDGPLYRKKTARLEDFDCGLFQTSSILASRDAYLQAHPDLARARPGDPLHNLNLLPFRYIKSIDPGMRAPITSATWDREKCDWQKGLHLSSSAYYNKIGNRRQQMRMAKRFKQQKENPLTKAAQKDEAARKVAAHMAHMSLHSAKTSSVAGCLSSLLYMTHCWADMFSFYGSRNSARTRFSSFQKKQRLIADIIEKLAPASERADTIIILGSAKFACSVKGAQSTPIGMLVKELSRVRRVVLVNEYFTTQMCSGCNLQGVGQASSHSVSDTYDKQTVLDGNGAPVASRLKPTSHLRFSPSDNLHKRNHAHHPTLSMASFMRTMEPAGVRKRREKRECAAAALAVRLRPPDAPPFPSPSPLPVRRKKKHHNPLSRAIHGLKQCMHCGRYWERDFGAARNIGWVFVGLWVCGVRPPHLRRTLVAASRSDESDDDTSNNQQAA